MAIARRIPSRFLQFLMVLILLITLGGAENAATAQSPVAEQLPIKVVRIFERLCPASVDPSAGTWQDARTSCPDVADGMIFTLKSDDSSYPQIPLTVNASGAVEWPEVPSGMPFTIAHGGSFEFGAAWVACQFIGNLDPAAQDTERIFWAPDHSISIGVSEPALSTYRVIECYWFDIPKNTGLLAESEVAVTPTPNPAVDVAHTSNAGVLAEEETQASASPGTSEAAMPDTSEASTTNAEALTDPGMGARVDIRAWQCPFHFDYTAATVAGLQAACVQPHRDARFTINNDPTSTQSTSSIGALSYQDVPYGVVTIRQEAYSSYDPVRVFCYTQPFTASHGPLDASKETAFTSEPGDAFSVTLNVASGEAVDCIWFDGWMTENDLGSVLIHKYVCPDGYNPASGGVNDLLSGCPTPQRDAYFELMLGGGISGGATDASGFMGFINYTPGSFTLRETAPPGYVTARVFCRAYNADDWDHVVDSFAEYTVANQNQISVQLQAHWELECAWFNIPGIDFGFVDINVWSCPLNFNPTASTPRNSFAQTCTGGVTGAEFEMSTTLSYVKTGTSNAGNVFYQEKVPAGPIKIYNFPPSTYTLTRTFCGSAPYIGIGAIPSTWTSSTGIPVTVQVPINYQVVCEFYYRPLAIAGAAASPEPDDADQESPAIADDSPTAAAAATTDETAGSPDDSTPTPAIVASQDGSSESSDTVSQAAAADTAALLLNLHTCPIGYDVYAPGADPAVDCAAATGAPEVTVNGTGSETSADGIAGWTTLLPGAALIQSQRPAFLGTCFSDARTLSSDGAVTPFVFTNANGAVGISLLGGETLTCDWYILDDRDPGTVSATLMSCPGTTVIEAQCTPAAGPATLHFEPVSDNGNAFDLEIDASGTGQASATGTYQLAEFPTGTCSIESDAFDATGALVIDPGAIVEVRIYLCGG